MGGKADWVVNDLPVEGILARRRRVIDVARTDVPTCGPGELLGDVRKRVLAGTYKDCVVVSDAMTVFGRLRKEAWEADPSSPVESVMEMGPGTMRPDPFLRDVIPDMQRARIGSTLVTQYGSHNDGGRLLGVLYRSDGEGRLAENE
ncbi:MAG TPA: hypothetical protein VFZ12_02020, partial [Dehalococcoidia bacterium]|nr:hypothetical protein [Dehalococcoidia bacterium]